jgi:hypothetical protein
MRGNFMGIDIHYLIMLSFIGSLLEVIGVALQYGITRDYPGINWWVWGYVSLALGFLLFNFYDQLPISFITVVVPNCLFVLRPVFLYVGITRFIGRKENKFLIFLLPALFIVVALYFTFVRASITGRTSALFLAVSLIALAATWQLQAHKPRNISASANYVSWTLLLLVLYFVIRTVALIF